MSSPELQRQPLTSTPTGTPLRTGDAYRFFVPLVAMTELNMISKSVIHAFLARTAAPDTTLAAFNIAFTFYYTITSASELASYLSIAYLRDRLSAWRLVRFLLLILSAPLTLALIAALTPLGDWLYGTVFGASARAVVEARLTTLILCLSLPVLVVRGVVFGLLMMKRRTPLITWSTLVRLASLAGSLLVWPLFLDGAPVGAAALVTCMAVETGFAIMLARHHIAELFRRPECEPVQTRKLWTFSWPIAMSQASELGVVFVVNLFLGRLVQADLALAAFGVVHGLVGLLMGPMRNLMQAAQTLVATSEDARVMQRFTVQLAVLFALLAAVLFLTPLVHWVLGDVMGLTGELLAYCVPAMRVTFAMAFFWAFAALFRGLLAGARSTTMLALSSSARILAVCAVGMATLVNPQINGAVVGLVAWILAYALECVVLGWKLRDMGYGR